MIYSAPETESMEVRLETNFLDSTRSASGVANISGGNILGGEEGEEW